MWGMGIDVSKYQETVRWDLVRGAGYRFAIVRAGYGREESQIDERFEEHLCGALCAGLCVGAYWFSYADTVTHAIEEAQLFSRVMKPYRGYISFPLAFDWEEDSQASVTRRFGALDENTPAEMAWAFMRQLQCEGWYPINYAGKYFYAENYAKPILEPFDLWLADYNEKPAFPCAIQQLRPGEVAGVEGPCDRNRAYKDFPAVIRAQCWNGY